MFIRWGNIWFWQASDSKQSLILRWPLRPVGLFKNCFLVEFHFEKIGMSLPSSLTWVKGSNERFWSKFLSVVCRYFHHWKPEPISTTFCRNIFGVKKTLSFFFSNESPNLFPRKDDSNCKIVKINWRSTKWQKGD